jgi:branched-subunit amino acid aminotransferase/4-amino-4-deoxychorismate lyase
MLIWQNQQWVEVPVVPAVEDLFIETFLFETLAIRGMKIECFDDHLARLKQSAKKMGIDTSKLYLAATKNGLSCQSIFKKLLESNGLSEGILRYVVAPRSSGKLVESLSVRPLPDTPPCLDLWSLNTLRDEAEWLPRPKTGPWKNSAAAWRELKKLTQRVDVEGVQCNAQGYLVEGTRSALAWYNGSTWFFPSPESGALWSTTAEQFKQVLQQGGCSFQEVLAPWPADALSVVVLRSTFKGGAVLARQLYDPTGRVLWQAHSNQAEASKRIFDLATWRAQRSVSFA